MGLKLFSTALASFTLACALYTLITPSLAQTATATTSSSEKKGDGAAVKGTANAHQRTFQPQDFHTAPPPAANVNKVDSLTVKQGAQTDDIGNARDYAREPGKLEYPNVTGGTATGTSTTTTARSH